MARTKKFCKTKGYHQLHWDAPEQMAIHISSIRQLAVNKRALTQHLRGLTAPSLTMLCSHLTQIRSYLIRLLFIRLPLQQESGA